MYAPTFLQALSKVLFFTQLLKKCWVQFIEFSYKSDQILPLIKLVFPSFLKMKK